MTEHAYHIVITPANDFDHVDNMVKWCKNHCEHNVTNSYYSWGKQIWYFDDKADAVLFALAWDGELR